MSGEHVVMDAGPTGTDWTGARCLHCDQTLRIGLPVSLNILPAALLAFCKQHKKCLPRPVQCEAKDERHAARTGPNAS